MRPLSWSPSRAGTLNGQVGPLLLFTVAYYPERGWFVAPALPGFNKTIPVGSAEEGKGRAEAMYRRYVEFLGGSPWPIFWF